MRKIGAFLALVCMLLIVGCVFTNDKMWISDQKYDQASKTYNETKSLNLTEKALRENGKWQPGEINEAIYRLKKENRLDQPDQPPTK
jgi:hypothetical protein